MRRDPEHQQGCCNQGRSCPGRVTHRRACGADSPTQITAVSPAGSAHIAISPPNCLRDRIWTCCAGAVTDPPVPPKTSAPEGPLLPLRKLEVEAVCNKASVFGGRLRATAPVGSDVPTRAGSSSPRRKIARKREAAKAIPPRRNALPDAGAGSWGRSQIDSASSAEAPRRPPTEVSFSAQRFRIFVEAPQFGSRTNPNPLVAPRRCPPRLPAKVPTDLPMGPVCSR